VSLRLCTAMAAFIGVVITALVSLALGLVSHAFAELEPAMRVDSPHALARLEGEIRIAIGIGALLAFLASVASIRWYVGPRLRDAESARRRLEKTTHDALQSAQLALRPRSVTPVELVWEIVELFRASAELKGLRISLEIDGSPPGFVHLDPDRLKQVLSNLISNALKFTHEGAVRVRLHSRPLGAGRTLLELSVSDTGPGIPENSLPKLFEAFSQLAGSDPRRHGGSGLGLAICRQIVTLMGGELGVTTTVGKGSVFTITLACDDDVDEDAVSPAPAGLVAGRKRVRLSGRGRVLVAEDSPVNREVMADFLNELSCDADFVTNGVEALEAVGRKEYDAVLMDCQMPELDGYEATRRIRSQPAERRIPIVAVTGHAFEEERVRTRQAGMDAFLSKPVKLDELAHLLDKLLPHRVPPALVATRKEPGRRAHTVR
jgi:CheY-like chemotaxis protein/two-component sensor histidine kinase